MRRARKGERSSIAGSSARDSSKQRTGAGAAIRAGTVRAMIPRLTPCIAIALAGLLSGAAAPAIAWRPSLDAALAEAGERKVPVFVAINMDGERANGEVHGLHLRDATGAGRGRAGCCGRPGCGRRCIGPRRGGG